MHNGAFKSLKEVVHFYNTRDAAEWPAPEVAENMNTDELGDLGLSDAEEDAIVAFMGTLSDGFRLEKVKDKTDQSAESLTSLEVTGPNPFNPSTAFSFTVAKDAQISIEIYDVQGRLMAVLANGWHAAGDYSLVWNAVNHASGMYFVVMRHDNELFKQRLLLIK